VPAATGKPFRERTSDVIRRIARKLRSLLAGAAPRPSAAAESDVFSGYLPEDESRVAALMVRPQPSPGVYVDAFGVKVDPAYCPWVKAGDVGTAPPFPNSYLCDGIEFASAALALEMAAGRPAFTAAELGAGWGPWTGFMALCAERAGFKAIHLAAFEADRERYEVMQRHLALNGISDGNRFKLATFCAAAWWRDETLYWPRGAGVHDAGLAATSGERPTHDYRGKAFDFDEIAALSIETALAGFPPIDFLHIDIQGSEWELISRSIDYLSSRVRTMFVGTHSRKIEGDLIDFLRARDWTLLRERPCRFYNAERNATLVGTTYHDGGQFWRNERQIGG
jgi:FkbM family methyltransferase